MIIERYSEFEIKKDLSEKMIFLGGPRQVGKMTLGLNILKTQDPHHPAYLNWDIVQHQSSLLKGELPAEEALKRPTTLLELLAKRSNYAPYL